MTVMSENEDVDDRFSYYTSSSEDDDQYYEEYVSKHVNFALDKFGDIKNIFLKYLIITWYLLDIISITSIVGNSDFFSKLIEEYNNDHHKGDCCYNYKLHDIKSNIKDTLELEMEISKHLRAPLDNCFIPRLKEIVWHYQNHKSVCKTAVESLFKCLSRTINLE